MNPKEIKARDFAIAAHKDQMYGNQPYVVHLVAARHILSDFFIENPCLVQAVWLHDVVEDTGVTREELEIEFGRPVAAHVWAVTGVGKNRKERNASIHAKIVGFTEGLPEGPAALKLADRIANVEKSREDAPDKFEMYRKEMPAFTEMLRQSGLLNTKTGKAMFDRLQRAFG